MKKKLLIVNNNLCIGGVQKSLVNLLQEIKNEYEITLFLFKKEGEYLSFIPREINIIEANKLLQILGTSQSKSKEIGIVYYLIRGGMAVLTKIFGNKFVYKILMNSQSKIGYFDCAISYLQSSNEKDFYGGCNEFVLKRVIAKQKITYVHSDFLNYGGNTKYNYKIYRMFDKVLTVSEGCKHNFLQAMPLLKDRTYCVRNTNNYNEIINQSNDNPISYDKQYFNIITVARLSEEKGITRCIPIIKRVIEKGFKLRWHIVGDGPMRQQIEDEINKLGLDENIILYKNQVNPYRYMKNADLFLLTSYHEAAPMVFDEARCLNIPILATQTTSTSEMIADVSAGWVCENDDNKIEESLLKILNNKEDLKKIKDHLKNEKCTNEEALKNLKLLIQ